MRMNKIKEMTRNKREEESIHERVKKIIKRLQSKKDYVRTGKQGGGDYNE